MKESRGLADCMMHTTPQLRRDAAMRAQAKGAWARHAQADTY